MRLTTTLVLMAALAAGGCAGTRLYQPSRTLGFDAYDDREIDDEAVRQAFETRPQLELPARVAYYSLDDDHVDEIEAMLAELPGVADVYRLPTLLVTGQRRLDGGTAPTRPITVRQLRLLAARARCDLLVVFDHGYRILRSPNGLAALNILLIPALFTPFVDAEVDSYLDALVIDTRNGFIYGHTSSEEQGRERFLNVWSHADEELAEEHWDELLSGTRESLGDLLRAGRPEEPAEPTLEEASEEETAAEAPEDVEADLAG